MRGLDLEATSEEGIGSGRQSAGYFSSQLHFENSPEQIKGSKFLSELQHSCCKGLSHASMYLGFIIGNLAPFKQCSSHLRIQENFKHPGPSWKACDGRSVSTRMMSPRAHPKLEQMIL